MVTNDWRLPLPLLGSEVRTGVKCEPPTPPPSLLRVNNAKSDRRQRSVYIDGWRRIWRQIKVETFDALVTFLILNPLLQQCVECTSTCIWCYLKISVCYCVIISDPWYSPWRGPGPRASADTGGGSILTIYLPWPRSILTTPRGLRCQAKCSSMLWKVNSEGVPESDSDSRPEDGWCEADGRG